MQIGLFETDAAGRLLAVDDGFTRLVLDGRPTPLGTAPWISAGPAERARAEDAWATQSAENGTIEIVVHCLRADGSTSVLRFLARPAIDVDGSRSGYRGVVVPDQGTSARLDLAQRELLALLEHSDDVVAVADEGGSLIHANRAALRFPAFVESVRDQLPRRLLDVAQGNWRGEVALRSVDGDLHTLDVQVTRSDRYMTYLGRDISAAVRLQAQLTHMATHDDLTGLPNRTLFLRKLSESIERCRSMHTKVAVFFIDIDRLKDVNDTIGHD
ncbi:MAG: diguanylate cyclase domain-containing protein, partial [Actinomycetota bacterium]